LTAAVQAITAVFQVITVWHPAGGALAVLVAFAIDRFWGEPPARWHPVVWMGRALAATGAPWPSATSSAAFIRGAVLWCAGALLSMVIAAMAVVTAVTATSGTDPPQGQPSWPLLLQGAMLGILLKPLFAWRLLHDEVAAVEQALTNSLEAGRQRLRQLVSRDTALLTATEVRESALESLAENLNDSLVAPLFWFAVGGLPAAALYRFANTADAMWGYRGRWEWAGKWSARADDCLSFVPARLTALLLSIAAPHWPRGLRREALRTPSPNGGWPMAMMALALDVRLGKPGVYVLHAGGRFAAAADVRRGLRVATCAAWLATVGTALALRP
jgi:adenosylcobinamide-phosphate synthase